MLGCLLLALSRDPSRLWQCPLLGVKRTLGQPHGCARIYEILQEAHQHLAKLPEIGAGSYPSPSYRRSNEKTAIFIEQLPTAHFRSGHLLAGSLQAQLFPAMSR
jgi:hypothetical protein